MSTLYLAYGGPEPAILKGFGKMPEDGPEATAPALLVSYVYLQQFLKGQPNYHYRQWIMDSGAYSAHNSGTVIDLQQYIATCQQLLEHDPKLKEVFALDVIGDWQAGLKNCEKMWQAGVPAIPTYHMGEPWHVLVSLAEQYPKIALGGVVLLNKKRKQQWVEQCFARVWPKKIHGLGMMGRDMVYQFPFHSTDASTWQVKPNRFGEWMAYSNNKVPVRGVQKNLKDEVGFYLRVEKTMQARWALEMIGLEKLPDIVPDVIKQSVIK